MLNFILAVILAICINMISPFKDTVYFMPIIWVCCAISGFLAGTFFVDAFLD